MKLKKGDLVYSVFNLNKGIVVEVLNKDLVEIYWFCEKKTRRIYREGISDLSKLKKGD